MTQSWNLPPTGTTKHRTFVKTDIPNALEALRSLFSGTTEPSAKVAYQFWADTTTGWLKQRNAANSAWIKIMPLLTDVGRLVVAIPLGDLSVTDSALVFVAPAACTVEQATIIAESNSGAGDDASNKLVWQLANVTQTLNLFSATVGTVDTDGSIGGGAITAETAYNLIPDQNQDIAADDVLKFTWTETGAAGTVTAATLQLTLALR